MEAGARTFLIDEDSSAVNFLIRDIRVRKLLGDDREPLIPLTDRIKEISAAGNSFILVAGACGDYLDIADNIIVMANYKAECPKAKVTEPYARVTEPNVKVTELAEVTNIPKVTELAEVTAKTNATSKVTELAEVTNAPLRRSFANYMQPLQKAVRPASAVERQVKVKLAGDTLLQIGFLVADTSRLNTLVDKQQRFGAGFMLLNLLQNAASNSDTPASEAPSKDCDTRDSIAGVAQKLCESIKNVGFRNLPQGMSREMSLPRAVDIACVAFRLRESR